jgi:hypothetical protein
MCLYQQDVATRFDVPFVSDMATTIPVLLGIVRGDDAMTHRRSFSLLFLLFPERSTLSPILVPNQDSNQIRIPVWTKNKNRRSSTRLIACEPRLAPK